MKFELKKPCPDCPFLKGSSTNRTLGKERLDEIKGYMHDDLVFTCHKTLDALKKEQQGCAGAMLYVKKYQLPNQSLQIAERLGFYDSHALDDTKMPDIVEQIKKP